MIRPVRLQLSRALHFNLQAHSQAVNGLPAINCARPGMWGNPFVVGHPRVFNASEAVDLFALYLAAPGSPNYWRLALETLPGHNLACWCDPYAPCHADVLLDIFGRFECREAA